MTAASSSAARDGNSPQLTVLVVEDDPLQRLSLVRQLFGMKCASVLEAENGKIALALMRDAPNIDIVLCDLEMPEMDGMEFIRHFGLARSAASLIINSSLGSSLIGSVEKMAAAYGVTLLGVLEKPVTPAALRELFSRYDPKASRRTLPLVPPRDFSGEEIAEALHAGQFKPFFQPKIDIATGALVGAEALARWDHPSYGLIYPGKFIAALERSNSMDELTRIMLRQSAEACLAWHKHNPELTVSVNVSAVSLGDTVKADQYTEIVRSAGLSPRHVILELTESAMIENLGATLENLARLRMRGFGLSIDDYGTGFSSMKQLEQVPFTELKIDYSFVTGCGSNPKLLGIVKSSIALAQSLGIKCVAEGVESQADWDTLKAAGCDIGQGYFYSNPMDPALFLDIWAAGNG
jgi:EAL domain-containing protein (putative c-di-GMP-specific phosphodiesterase class I)